MADVSILSRLLNGVQRNVDLSANALVVGSLKVGSSSPAELTKTILERLISAQDGSDLDSSYHTHDTQYFTESELGSSSGSDLIGDDATYSNFTPTAATVKGALEGIDSALASTADEKAAVSATDTTPGYLNDKIVVGVGSNATNALEASIVNGGGDEDLLIQFDNAKVDHGALMGLGDDDHTQYHNDTRGDARYYQKSEFVTTSSAGAPVKLDGGGKIALAQLPSAIMTYEGVWDASSNTPTLADGVGDTGMVYRVGTAGSQDLGSGSISFDVGDYAIYNGTTWEKSDTTDAVASVNGMVGIVSLDTDDINEGTSNKYFADERAQDAIGSILLDTATIDFTYDDATPNISAIVKANSISESHLTTSVAGDGLTGGAGSALAVGAGDGISVAADAISVDVTAIAGSGLESDGSNNLRIAAAAAGAGLAGGAGSALSVSYAPRMLKSMTAGEAYAAQTSFLVRFAMSGESAGSIYKADKDATSNDAFYAIGVAMSAAGVAGGAQIDVTLQGTHVLGSSDTPFSSGDIGKPVYLTAAGAFSVTAPSSANEAVYRIGVVESTTKIWVGTIQLNGIN